MSTQGFSHFSGFLHPFVLAKLATSSIRVNVKDINWTGKFCSHQDISGVFTMRDFTVIANGINNKGLYVTHSTLIIA